MSITLNVKNNDDSPLPLSQLKKWIPSNKIYKWIQEGDEKQALLEKELEENSGYNVSNLFDNGDDSDDDNNNNYSTTSKDGQRGKKTGRVQEWSSSLQCVDGVGGYQKRQDKQDHQQEELQNEKIIHDKNNKNSNDTILFNPVNIVFILSESYKGFGDTLWSSARHVANVLANPIKCRDILSPLLVLQQENLTTNGNDNNSKDFISPLFGQSFLELGAGAGVPSWTAMHCGARVVCTDLCDTNRIRSIGECAERNYQLMTKKYQEELEKNHDENSFVVGLLKHASMSRVCPHDWGTPVDDVLLALNHYNIEIDQAETSDNIKDEDTNINNKRFDIIIAADCCYMPWLHEDLLNSIYTLLSDIGVALIAFALHGNTDDDDVWKIVDRAKDRGFSVEVLQSQQLSPPNAGMELKQGLVHTLRLTKPKNE